MRIRQLRRRSLSQAAARPSAADGTDRTSRQRTGGKICNAGNARRCRFHCAFCTTHNAVLLSNHGALTWGKDLQAFYRLESVEYYAMITMYTENILGKANYLSEKQIEPLLKTRENMGNHCGGEPMCSAKEMNGIDFMPQSGTVRGIFDGP